ncbi:hypothetical protein F5144DRAFT_518509 [Chaetomium tenue]|uniref:Uncharacterized protein n=1 Tax=Chaetomium tenue TaxID=1854479 RepID=A0ACB7NYA5_9PEZI|nr:hypothetical protein F5144DRAFT_518509 [Chaetomium globosum]
MAKRQRDTEPFELCRSVRASPFGRAGVNPDSDDIYRDTDYEETDGDTDNCETYVEANNEEINMCIDSSVMQQLQSKQLALQSDIDGLCRLGLDHHVEPSQVIAVGDRSAGKTSVLEAILHIRFPSQEDIYMDFTTEVVLSPSFRTRVAVTIRTDGRDTFNASGLNECDLQAIFQEAKQHMGMSNRCAGLSEDDASVLRIEIAGPGFPQLTLVDLPRFSHAETGSQNNGSVGHANPLAEKYMSQENTIILAVFSAQNDLTGQQVLGEVKKYDPGLDRTMGIITKPDEVDDQPTKRWTYLELAQNKKRSHKLKLGWHVLRNPTKQEAGSTEMERVAKEYHFFHHGVWAMVSPEDRGIQALRGKLSRAILTRIQRHLPAVIANAEEYIRTRKARLESLGAHRWSTADITKYLIGISNRFQRVAQNAIQGNYTDNFFGGLYPKPYTPALAEGRRIRKLRALVRDMNWAFCFILATKGCRRQIDWGYQKPVVAPKHLEPFLALYVLDERVSISSHDLAQELDNIASENQGVGFSDSPNDTLALALFRDQAAPWKGIAKRHVFLVAQFSQRFVEELVVHIAGPDSTTADAIINHRVAPYFEQKRATLEAKVLELLQHYKTGDLQPMSNDIFFHGVPKRRSERFSGQGQQVSKRLEFFRNGENLDGSTDAIPEVPQASSETSLRVFADNVMTLALENCLISDIPNILSPEVVCNMTDDELKTLAADSKHAQSEREELRAQIKELQSGLAACRKHRPRHLNGMMATQSVLPKAEPESERQSSPLERKAPIPTQSNPPPSVSSFASSIWTDSRESTPELTGKLATGRHTADTARLTPKESRQSASGEGFVELAPPPSSLSTKTTLLSDASNTGNTSVLDLPDLHGLILSPSDRIPPPGPHLYNSLWKVPTTDPRASGTSNTGITDISNTANTVRRSTPFVPGNHAVPVIEHPYSGRHPCDLYPYNVDELYNLCDNFNHADPGANGTPPSGDEENTGTISDGVGTWFDAPVAPALTDPVLFPLEFLHDFSQPTKK